MIGAEVRAWCRRRGNVGGGIRLMGDWIAFAYFQLFACSLTNEIAELKLFVCLLFYCSNLSTLSLCSIFPNSGHVGMCVMCALAWINKPPIFKSALIYFKAELMTLSYFAPKKCMIL